MYNQWELEEDDDSDVYEESNDQKVAVKSAGGKQQGVQNSSFAKAHSVNETLNSVSLKGHFNTSLPEFYSDDGMDDLDIEELPESFPTGKNNKEVTSKLNSNDHRFGDNSARAASAGNPLDRENISVEKLKQSYDEAAVKASIGGGYSSEPSVDKIELSRIIRHSTNAPSLADDILNLSKRAVSWGTLVTVARPYMEKEKSPLKSTKDAGHDMGQNDQSQSQFGGRSASKMLIDGPIIEKVIEFRLHSDDEDDKEDEERKRVRDNETERTKKSKIDLNPLSATDPSKVSEIKWSTQPKKEWPLSKSMEQESWHNQADHRPQEIETIHRDEHRSEGLSVITYKGTSNENASYWTDRDSQIGSMEAVSKPRTPPSSSYLDRVKVNGEHTKQQGPEQQLHRKLVSEHSQQSELLIAAEDAEDDKSDSSSVAQQRRRAATNGGTHTQSPVDSDRTKASSPNDLPKKSVPSEKKHKIILSPSQPPLYQCANEESPRSIEKAGTDSAKFLSNSMVPVASSWETAISAGSQKNSTEVKNNGKSQKKLPRPQNGFERKKNNMGYTRSKGKGEERPASLPLPQNETQDSYHMSDREGTNRPRSLSQSADDIHVKRSISWSPTVSSNRKPPRPKSTSSLQPPIFISNFPSNNKDQYKTQYKDERLVSSYKDSLVNSHDFDGHVLLPPLAEYAQKTGVVMEGWVEKKSSVTGLWQKRYFVLSESSIDFCVLKIFYKVVDSAWGPIPLKLKGSIPISAIQSVSSVSAKIKKGREFSLSFLLPNKRSDPYPKPQSRSRSSTNASQKEADKSGQSRFQSDQGYASSNNESAGEDSVGVSTRNGDGRSKIMKLRAENLQARILWVTLLDKVLYLYNNEDDNYSQP